MQNLSILQQDAISAINNADNCDTLEDIRIEYLGKKGRLTDILKNLVNLPASEKPVVGQLVNQVKRDLSLLIDQKLVELKEVALLQKLATESLDVTLPGRSHVAGSIHPITQTKQRIMEYFRSLGFEVVDGPEIETEFYNFEALNIPDHHPARAMHDTFYVDAQHLLRTHTSPVQIRALEKRTPPLRLIAPGRVYRCDSDLTHTPMFHQVEGFMLDQHTTLADLKGTLHEFFSHLFGRTLAVRFRPSYFPFTEPSAEFDIECTQCHGKGCRMCKFTGWLEVGGCGMIHPHVLRSVNIDPSVYQGWAFGMGIDRLAMLYYDIDDLRMMFENDITFLSQF